MLTGLYLAYGSNLSSARMRERVASAQTLGVARLEGWRLACDKRGRDGSGKANIVPDGEAVVWGVVYRLERGQLSLLDRYEGGYDRVELEVVEDGAGRVHRVISYSVRDKQRFRPSEVYLQKMLRWGAHWSFPSSYLELLGLARTLPRGVAPRPTRSQPRPR